VAVGVGSFEVDAQGRVGGSVADAALQEGVRFHGGVARPELVGKPLEGVRDADAQGAEALAVALKGYFKGRCAANEVVEYMTPAGGVSLSVCPSRCRHGRASISPPNDP
jgi:hypothetical protein